VEDAYIGKEFEKKAKNGRSKFEAYQVRKYVHGT